jgi:hypothetical protein
MVGGAKALLDVLQPPSKRHPYGLGVIAGDDPAHLTVEYRSVQASRRRDQKMVIEITDTTP